MDPNMNASNSSLRHLPQSFHFDPKMRPTRGKSTFSPHRVNSNNPNFISFGNSDSNENRRRSQQPYNNRSPFPQRPRFNFGSNHSTPNSSRNHSFNNSFCSPNNHSFNNSFCSPNNSFNGSQSFSPHHQRQNRGNDNWVNTESYRSMFGNPWAKLEESLKQKFGDKLVPFQNCAVHSKNGMNNGTQN